MPFGGGRPNVLVSPGGEGEERRPRLRLASDRAKLYDRSAASPIATEISVRALERKWKGAAERVRRDRRPAP